MWLLLPRKWGMSALQPANHRHHSCCLSPPCSFRLAVQDSTVHTSLTHIPCKRAIDTAAAYAECAGAKERVYKGHVVAALLDVSRHSAQKLDLSHVNLIEEVCLLLIIFYLLCHAFVCSITTFFGQLLLAIGMPLSIQFMAMSFFIYYSLIECKNYFFVL